MSTLKDLRPPRAKRRRSQPDGTVSAPLAAELLGVRHMSIVRWWRDWYGPLGSGRRIYLTPVDLMVARAWHAINGDGGPPPHGERDRTLAEGAIRSEPRRWLLLTPDGASTHDTAGDAASTWSEMHDVLGTSFARIIDLEPRR